jgi:hypothetical protein
MSLVPKISPAIGNGPEAMRSIASTTNRIIDVIQPMGTLISTAASITVGETYGDYLANATATVMTYNLPLAAAHGHRRRRRGRLHEVPALPAPAE